MARISITPFDGGAGFTIGSYSLSVNAGTTANRLMEVWLVHESSQPNSIVSATYAGVSMNMTSEVIGGTGGNYKRRLLWLLNPASGTNSLAITATGDHKYRLIVVIHDGVSSVSGATISSVIVGTTQSTPVTSAIGSLVTGFIDGDPAVAFTQIGGTTEYYDAIAPASGAGTRLWYGEAAGAATAVTIGATTGSTVAAVVAGLSLVPVAAGGPTISGQPSPQTVTAGATANFSVTAAASGGGALSYQWFKDAVAIGGATNSTYARVTVIGDNGSQISVTVTETGGSSPGSLASNNALLTVNAAAGPVITGQPLSTTAGVGQAASFSVFATGTPTITFQWRLNGSNIPGATLQTYTTASLVLGDSGKVFSVLVTNGSGTTTSNNATLTVQPSPPTYSVSIGVGLLDGSIIVL